MTSKQPVLAKYSEIKRKSLSQFKLAIYTHFTSEQKLNREQIQNMDKEIADKELEERNHSK